MTDVLSSSSGEITEGLRQLLSQELLVLGIVNDPAQPDTCSHLDTDHRSERVLVLPWLEGLGITLTPHGKTQLLGPDIESDLGDHRDIRSADIVNVHYTYAGSLSLRYGIFPREMHERNGDFRGDLKDQPDAHERIIRPGMTVCFLGGVLTHKFESGPHGRRSAVRSFRAH